MPLHSSKAKGHQNFSAIEKFSTFLCNLKLGRPWVLAQMTMDCSKVVSIHGNTVEQHKLFGDVLLFLYQIASEVCHVWQLALNFPIVHLL